MDQASHSETNIDTGLQGAVSLYPRRLRAPLILSLKGKTSSFGGDMLVLFLDDDFLLISEANP
jgi:hypothetical protein